MNDSWLVMADVDAVQSYLFSSLHLREIAGASTLLVEHDAAVQDMPGASIKTPKCSSRLGARPWSRSSGRMLLAASRRR